MKHYLFGLILISLSSSAWAQSNLLSNGDFEHYRSCAGVVDAAVWDYIYTGTTADYYNVCGGSVPNNGRGAQAAASGNAYIGLDADVIHFEDVRTNISPLSMGAFYEASMSVSLSDSSKYANNSLGILFSINQSPAFVWQHIPQVSFASYGPITDKINWVRVKKIFVADSAYNHLYIGGFLPLLTQSDTMATGFSLPYYLIDSVVLKLAYRVSTLYSDSLLCAGDTINIPYGTFLSNHFHSNNIFTVQLSGSNGSFASPTIIGTRADSVSGVIQCIIPTTIAAGTGYKIRIVSSNVADTSNETPSIKIGSPVVKPVAGSNSPVCQGSNINLFASTTTVNTALKWSWAGPNGFTSSQQNPTILNPIAANAGNYIVTASIYGCKAKDTTAVILVALPAPLAVTATSNSPVCATDTLKLFSTNSSTGALYSWTGPNGFTAGTQNTSIIHPVVAASGDYIISATLNGCSIKDTVTVLAKPVPANFNATGNSPVCVGSNFNMNASSTSSGVSYTWIGPGSFTAAVSNPVLSNVNALSAGDYIATATLNGCSLKDTLALVVNPLPAKPIANSNTPVCSGNSLNLTASTSTTGVAYSWTGPNSFSSSLQTPSIGNTTIAGSGDYIVTAVVITTGCTAKDTETVLIKPTPVVNATNNSPICEGSTVNIFSTATPAGTFSWTGPVSFSSAAQNPTLPGATPATSGDYIVSVTLNGCTGKDTTTVLVNPQPIIPLTNANTSVCLGMTLQLTAASNAGSSYNWSGPNSFTSLLQNPTRANISIADAGVYSVTATLNSCTSVAGTTTVSVNPLPFVNIYSTPADSICQGSTVTFVALAANTSTPAYRWTRNSSPTVLGTNSTLITTNINNNDIIRCEMTETTKCGTAFKDTSNEVKMTVLPWLAPSVSISSNPTTPLSPYELITFTAIPVNAGNNPKYQWQRNSSDVIGAISSTWSTQQLSNNDSISVILTSDYRCPQPKTAGSNSIKVIVLTGVDDVRGNSNISLYPNPNNGSFTIKGNVNNNKEVTIQIVNAVGQLVYETKTLPKNKELDEQVNVQHLANGVYLIRIKDSIDSHIIKFKIER